MSRLFVVLFLLTSSNIASLVAGTVTESSSDTRHHCPGCGGWVIFWHFVLVGLFINAYVVYFRFGPGQGKRLALVQVNTASQDGVTGAGGIKDWRSSAFPNQTSTFTSKNDQSSSTSQASPIASSESLQHMTSSKSGGKSPLVFKTDPQFLDQRRPPELKMASDVGEDSSPSSKDHRHSAIKAKNQEKTRKRPKKKIGVKTPGVNTPTSDGGGGRGAAGRKALSKVLSVSISKQ